MLSFTFSSVARGTTRFIPCILLNTNVWIKKYNYFKKLFTQSFGSKTMGGCMDG